eukprot:TRINITY_DN5174_c0_g2_i1.p1 TRINITY_DN5174_c0_g2~~TRINITY_DN5174_c0_g2_i1.p1  ORF type:complete len:551 (+),score=176.22 TRINITY_DN5174_c0_g2_i1:626-2278(+)
MAMSTAAEVPERELWQAEANVVSALLQALRATPAVSRPLLKHLVALGRLTEAAECFFAHRSEWVLGELQRVKHAGDVEVYARNASGTVFRSLAATHKEFVELFTTSVGTSPRRPDAAVAGTSLQERVAMMRSTSVRWITHETRRLGALLRNQVFAGESFTAQFASLAEICKACRDILEPKGLGMLPTLHRLFQDEAAAALVKACVDATAAVNRAFDADAFYPHTEDTVEDLCVPPLFGGRSQRQERMKLLLSPSAHTLVARVAGLLQSVRAVCLDFSLFDSQRSGHGERPFSALEEQVDRLVQDMIKQYNERVFEIAGQQSRSPREHMAGYAVMLFVARKLLPRAATVLCRAFHRSRATQLHHLDEKTKKLPGRYINEWVNGWRMAGNGPDAVAEELKHGGVGPVLRSARELVQHVASVLAAAEQILQDDEDTSGKGGGQRAALSATVAVAQAIEKDLLSEQWWRTKAGLQPGLRGPHRRTAIVTATLVQSAFDNLLPSIGAKWQSFRDECEVTPVERAEADEIIIQDGDAALKRAFDSLQTCDLGRSVM